MSEELKPSPSQITVVANPNPEHAAHASWGSWVLKNMLLRDLNEMMRRCPDDPPRFTMANIGHVTLDEDGQKLHVALIGDFKHLSIPG